MKKSLALVILVFGLISCSSIVRQSPERLPSSEEALEISLGFFQRADVKDEVNSVLKSYSGNLRFCYEKYIKSESQVDAWKKNAHKIKFTLQKNGSLAVKNDFGLEGYADWSSLQEQEKGLHSCLRNVFLKMSLKKPDSATDFNVTVRY